MQSTSCCLPSNRSPTREQYPLFQPAGSPKLSSHRSTSLEDKSRQLRDLEKSGDTSLGAQSSLLKDPPSYTREIPEEEGHRLVERGEIVSRFRDMDVEAIERMKEKDTKLKRNIRRFRFIVRCAKLCCRFYSYATALANYLPVSSSFHFFPPILQVLILFIGGWLICSLPSNARSSDFR